MTEQEKQKLNEKLAGWAGFILYADPTPGIGIYCIRPDKTGGIFNIDFTDSLDACFKWLVPKAVDEGYDIGIFVNHRIVISRFAKPEFYTEELNDGIFATPLALCLAIEKLIEQ